MAYQLIPMAVLGAIRLATPIVARALAKAGFKEATKTAAKKAGKTATRIKPQEVLKIVKNQKTSSPRNRLQAIKSRTTKKVEPKTTKKVEPEIIKKVEPKTKITPKTTKKVKPKTKITPKTTKKVKPEKTTKEFYEKAGFKKSDAKPKQLKFQPKKTTREFYEKAGFKKPSGNVPAKLKKLPLVDQQKIARLGGLSNVKKGTPLWKKLVSVGLITATVVGPTLIESKKTADATLKNKKRKSVEGSRGRKIEKPGERAKAFKAKPKPKQQISGEGEMAAGIKDSGVKGPAKSRPAWLNNPIAKEIIKSRGGEKTFAKDSISSKIGKNIFGEGDDVTAIDKMKTSVYNTLRDEYGSDTPMDSEREAFMKTLYNKKGGKVGKRKKVGKKKQGYKARKDESIAMRVKKKRTKKQLKASRNESYGKWGKGKGKGKINRTVRGVGAAKRGWGKANYSSKLY